MSSIFGQIRSGTTELAPLEHLKIDVAPFSRFTNMVYLGNSQVSVYRTIGLLVLTAILLLIIMNVEDPGTTFNCYIPCSPFVFDTHLS